MPNIVKQYTKFIFPFQYDRNLVSPQAAQIENKKGAKFNLFERFSQKCELLRDGLDLLLSENGGTSSIAECYKMNINCRKNFLLPPKKNEMLDFVTRQSDGNALKVAITELKLYFFESQTGFVEVECEFGTKTLEEYFDLNYFISEPKSDKNYFIFHEKIWNEEQRVNEKKDSKFSIAELLEKLLSSVSKEKDAIRFSYQKAKPIIYSYLLVDEKPEDMNDILQHLGKNYKASYKFDDSCTSIKMLHPFENSYWVSSLNGVVNLSYLTDDDVTNDFFGNSFYTKTKDTYYFLFLNILHQRYAISYIMGQMGQLDRLTNDYFVMEEELKLARRYEAEALNLKFRAFFKCPSMVDHINNYYDMIYESFQVGAFYDNFSSDIKNLQNICGKYVDRIKSRDEKLRNRKNAKIEIFISIFGTLVAEVTLFNNSWSLIEKVLGRSVSFWSPVILILLGTLVSPLITIVFNVSKKASEIKQLSSQINSEEKERLVEDDKKRRITARCLKKTAYNSNKNQKKAH